MSTDDLQNISPATTDSPGIVQPRRKHPCVLCQQRKVKCDRSDPCANCTKARVECISPTTLPPKRRKKRFPEAELLARLRRYEEALRIYGVDIDALNAEGGSVPVESVLSVQLKNPPLESAAQRLDAIKSLAVRRSLKHIKNDLWEGISDEVSSYNGPRDVCLVGEILTSFKFRDAEELLQGSSDDEELERPIIRTFDTINEDGGNLLFSSPASEGLRDLHPSAVHIFRLWQTFLDSVNPVIKIFHAPTVQQKILEASADLDNIPKPMEALMFGIYCMSIRAFNNPDCKATFGEEKETLIARYHAGARQALLNAGFLRTSDMTILQALALFLLSCLNFAMDPRSLFCLSGIAVRIAQRMGLNFDGTTYGLPPFETEMRRRLWWQLMLLDFRVAELSGAGHSVITHVWSTKLPLNVNDSDLFPDMRDPPSESPGVTEMVYVLQRCEFIQVSQEFRDSNESLAVKDKIIDELEARLERKHSQYCDPSVPLHLLTILMGRSSIPKLRIGPRHPHLFSALGNSLQSAEKDTLFVLSLEMLENAHKMMQAETLSRFTWHVMTNMPFPAYVYILCSLRHRTTGELADRAWQTIQKSFEAREAADDHNGKTPPHHRDTVLHTALLSLLNKAWDARVKAIPALQVLPPPRFIAVLREELAAKRSPKTTTENSAITPKSAEAEMGDGDPQFGGGFEWLNALNQTNIVPAQLPLDQGFMDGFMGTDISNMNWEFWNDMILQTPMTGVQTQGAYGQGNMGQDNIDQGFLGYKQD